MNASVEIHTIWQQIIFIDPELLERALELGGKSIKRAIVNKALRNFIARREQPEIIELFGTLAWEGGYDYKQGRSRNGTIG